MSMRDKPDSANNKSRDKSSTEGGISLQKNENGNDPSGKPMTNQVLELPTLDKIELEASEWVEKLDRGLDASEYRAFKQWISRSKRHHDSVVAMAELWDQIDIQTIIEDSEVISLSSWRDEEVEESTPFFSSLLASLILIVGLFGAGLYFFQDVTRILGSAAHAGTEQAQGLQTAVGEVKSFNLPDGSRLYLNTDSTVNVNYSSDLRSIVLNSGELYVEVAKESSRPLLVVANGRMIRATGTAFNVKWLDGEKVELTVTEGKVIVNEKTDESKAVKQVIHAPIIDSYEVNAGQRVVIGGDEVVYRLAPQNLYALSFWRENKLLFTGESLAYVVAEMSRYTDKKISLVGEEAEKIRINGLFEVNDIGAFVSALETELNIQANYSGEDQIELYTQ